MGSILTVVWMYDTEIEKAFEITIGCPQKLKALWHRKISKQRKEILNAVSYLSSRINMSAGQYIYRWKKESAATDK